MREEGNYLKPNSWPETVARKWLNLKSGSEGFHSDYNSKAIFQRRCSEDAGHSVVVPEELSEEWLMETSNKIEWPGFNKLESPVTTSLNLRMFVGTWNVGGKTPHEDLNLNDWLKTKTPADIYVLGFQEIVPLNAGNVLGPEDYGPAEKWITLIRDTLNNDVLHSQLSTVVEEDSTEHDSKYCLVAKKQMVGIFLTVWVRNDLSDHITRLKVSCVARGLMGYLGNKGSVSISMTLNQTTFCFVCTHLASGEKDGDEIRRNLDVMEILRKTRFSISPHTIYDHDKIIWLGDLNYRLSSPFEYTYKMLQTNDWQALLRQDQLKIEQKVGRIFQGWEEGDIYFAPTYKYIPNSDNYVAQTSSNKGKRRTPAWCDRILWKGEGMKQMCYFRSESRFSDHKPVYSVFITVTGGRQ